MFPERIDKLIIDGVQNPHEYYHAWAYVFSLASLTIWLTRADELL